MKGWRRGVGLISHPDRSPHLHGNAIIFVTVAITTCIAFSVLTLDVGMILTTKIQLQNAADAAALAGASALILGNQAEARSRAIAVASQNLAWQDGLDQVVIGDLDVTFPSASRCRVRTHRTRATGAALRTFFVQVLNPDQTGWRRRALRPRPSTFKCAGRPASNHGPCPTGGTT